MMMLRNMTRVAALALILAGSACSGQPGRQTGENGTTAGVAGSSAQENDRVQMAARIAREIQADPENAEAILDRHGKTKEEFEALLYEIAAEPELSRAYNAAMAR